MLALLRETESDERACCKALPCGGRRRKGYSDQNQLSCSPLHDIIDPTSLEVEFCTHVRNTKVLRTHTSWERLAECTPPRARADTTAVHRYGGLKVGITASVLEPERILPSRRSRVPINPVYLFASDPWGDRNCVQQLCTYRKRVDRFASPIRSM